MKRLFLLVLFAIFLHAAAQAQPAATSFSATVSTVGSSAIGLLGTVDTGTLTFGTHLSGCASCVQPTHGKLSNFNAGSGIVIYTPDSGYTGSDSFGFTAIKDGSTSSSEATVTITVTSAKTTIADKLLNPDGSARTGKVTWILTQPANSPEGIIPASATVTSDLTAGAFTVSLYPTRSLSPQTYYQLWAGDASNLKRELIGVFDIPASAATITSIQPYRVTDTNRQTRYNFVEYAAFQAFATKANSFGVLNNGTLVGTRPSVNFIPGANISLNIVDNGGAGRVDVTITGPGGGGGGVVGSATSGQLPVYNGATSITGLAFAGANKILKTNTSNNGIEWATLTAGTGISVTPGAGSITIASNGIATINGAGGGAHTITTGIPNCASIPTVTTSINTTTVCIPVASATAGGYVTASGQVQTLAGEKIITGFDTSDVPLTVRQFPSGSSTLQSWQDSAGTMFAQMVINGPTQSGLFTRRLGLGNFGTAVSAGYVISLNELDPPDGNRGAIINYRINANNSFGSHVALLTITTMRGSGTHTGTFISGHENQFLYDASGTTASSTAYRARYLVTNSGTATNTHGYYSTVEQSNGNNTSHHHFYAAVSPFDTGGARTNEYGLYVESLTKATNNWGVYTAGTMGSSLGGFLDLRGRTAPSTSGGSEFRMYMDSGANRPKASFNGTVYGFIPTYLTASASLEFVSTSAGSSQDLTITVTGATTGQMVWLGVPNVSMNANCVYFAWVSAANTVTVRHLNNSGSPVDPTVGTFTVGVVQ